VLNHMDTIEMTFKTGFIDELMLVSLQRHLWCAEYSKLYILIYMATSLERVL